jgi:hypothetical protein
MEKTDNATQVTKALQNIINSFISSQPVNHQPKTKGIKFVVKPKNSYSNLISKGYG